MLEKLLQLVATGGVHSYEDLSEQLGISQPLLEAMLEDLARLGYLYTVDDRCEGHCAGCSMGSCSVTGPGRLWALTERGSLAADRLAV
jgi:hypothetical protein